MQAPRGVIARRLAGIFGSSRQRASQPPFRKRIAFESLENRLLLSADPAAAGSLLVVDGSVADQAALERFAADDVLVLDQNSDGLEQITRALAARSGEVSSLHIVSHGWNGSLALGSATLDAASLETHQAQLRAWADALTADADILFYGCNLAADDAGIAFVDQLSDLTGADVAASTDLTGSAAKGGDWDLEYATGSIEADALAPAGDFVLATVNYNAATDALTFTADAGEVDSVIITSPGANQLRIIVGNGDTIQLTGDTTAGFTLEGESNQLLVDTATAAVLTLGASLGDQDDLVTFVNNQLNGLGSVSIDGGEGTDHVNQGTAFLGGSLTLGAESVAVLANAQINVGGNAINAAGAGVNFNTNATVTAATFTADSLSIGGGVVSLNASTTAGSLSLSGGGLSGAGDVTLTGAGSSWSAGSMSGAGDLTLAPGATLSINGTSSKTIDGKDIVNHGTIDWTGGAIAVVGNATLTNTGDLNLGANATFGTGSGSITLNNAFTGALVNTGGTNILGGGISVLNQGAIQVNTGTLEVTGSITQAGTIDLASGATLRHLSGGFDNAGVISGSGTLDLGTGTLTNSGTIRPGASAGLLSIIGNLSLTPTSVLDFELAGAARGTQYDAINVSGAAFLGGTANVVHLGGFAPTANDAFVVIETLAVIGTFSSVNPPAGFGATTVYGANQVTFQVGPNTVPDARDDFYMVDEDRALLAVQPFDGGVLANDLDADGDTLRVVNPDGSVPPPFDLVVPVDDVDHGFLELLEDGGFVYTPHANFNGTDSFTYRVSDGHGGSDTATVTIFVVPQNDSPVANDDAASTNEDQAVTLAVLGNDTDVEGDALTVSALTQGTNGSVVLNGDGTITYTPNANFFGTDSFTYTVTDAQFASSFPATVTITVLAQNDAPVALDDSASTNQDQAVTVAVLANDTDVEGDALTVSGVTQGANGAVVLNADGTITYTPGAGFSGSDSFQYTLSDGQGGAATATVSLTVNAVNQAPVAVDDFYQTGEDQALLAAPFPPFFVEGVLQRGTDDSDPDGDTLRVVNANGSSPVNFEPVVPVDDVDHGWLELSEDGTFVYTPHANFNGTDSFIYRVSDGRGGFDTATVTISVLAQNDAPVALDDSASTNEDQAVTFAVLGNDTDVDGDSLTLSVGQVANGTVVINADGSITYTPSANFNGSDSFTYTVSDGHGGFASAGVTVTVNAVNDAPVAGDDSAVTNEDQAVTVAVLANDTDVDGDTLAVDSVTQGTNGTVVLNGDGSITYTPNASFAGTDSFSYTLSDGQGGTATATVSLTVNAVNQAPVAMDDGFMVEEDRLLMNVNVLANDRDDDLDQLSVELLEYLGAGDVVLGADGSLIYAPGFNFNGTESFTYRVSDGQGGSDTATVTILVMPQNDSPVALDDSASTNEDQAVTFAVLGNDTDVDGDSLTLSVGQVANGTVVINADGSITYTPSANFNGSDSFSYTVSDALGASASAIVTVNVAAVNDAPVAGDDSASTNQNQAVAVAVLANDTDVEGDALTVSGVTQGANGAVVLNADGTITYTPGAGFSGSDSFQYTLSDGQGGAATATVSLTVNAVNQAPAAADDAATINEDQAVTLAVLGNDTDVEGDTLTVAGVTQGANGSVVLNADGTLTYTPNANFNGTDSFEYTLSDGALTDTGLVTITLTPVNDAPVAIDDVVTTGQGVAVTVVVLTNDTDVDGDILVVDSVSRARSGTVALGADGTVTYTPNAGFIGTDSFRYTVDDGQGEFDTATVFLTVNAVNHAPVAGDDSLGVAEDGMVLGTFNVLANDTDADADALTVVQVQYTGLGSADITPDGRLFYSPELNFNGTDSLTYWVSDGQGGSDIATVTLTVEARNDAPIAADDVATTNEDQAVTLAVLGNDTDVEGDSFTLISVGAAANGTVVNNGDGTLTYTPNANFNGTDSFLYTVSDGQPQGTASAMVTITVNAVNDAPVAGDDLATTDEDTAVTFAVLANDGDVDGDSLTVSSVGQGANGSVLLNADGSITYTPNANFSGTDFFGYTVRDGALADTGLVTITVMPVNDLPVAGDDAATTDQNSAVTVAVLANDTDVDGDILTVTDIPQGQGPTNGSVVINADGTITYTPNAGFSGTDTFSYTVENGPGATDIGLVTITVNAAQNNAAPVFVELADRTVTEGRVMRFTVGATDADDPWDSLVYSVTSGLPAGATFNADTGEFVWVPADNGTYSVTFTVLDPDGASDTMEMVLRATNARPTVNAGTDQVVGLQRDGNRREATVQIAAVFNDLGTLDRHTASIDWGDGRTTTGTVTESPFSPGSTAGANGTVTGSHTYTRAGTYTVRVTVTDDDGGRRTDTLIIRVREPSSLLRGRDDDYRLREDGVLQVNAANGVLANDRAPAGAPIQARLLEGPRHGELIFNANGSFTYRPDANFNGRDSFLYEFTDGVNVSRPVEVDLRVRSDGQRETLIDWAGRLGLNLPQGGQANFVDFVRALARRLS